MQPSPEYMNRLPGRTTPGSGWLGARDRHPFHTSFEGCIRRFVVKVMSAEVGSVSRLGTSGLQDLPSPAVMPAS